MKRICLGLLLVATVASAQVYPPDASSGTATTVSPSAFPLLAPDGDLEAPSYSFTNLTEGGMFISGSTLVLQNQGVDPSDLGRSRASFGTAFFSLYATDDAATRQGYFQASDEASAEVRVRMGSTFDTNNETEIYIDPDAINMRVEAGGVDNASFDLDEGSTAIFTLTEGSNTATSTLHATYFILESVETTSDVTITGSAAVPSLNITVDDGAGESNVFVMQDNGSSFTDPVSLPNGSFAAPALTFTGDTDAGMYYLSNGPALQNQASTVIDGRTWTVWQDETFLTTMWFDATPNGTASMRLGDLGTEEPGFQVFLDSAVGNDIEFTASTVGAEPEFSFVLNDGGAGDVEVLQMIDTAATFATPVFLPDGTAAAPSLSFTSQTDAGLNYQDSINTILLQTSETASFARLSMNGEAGTGTPYFQLDADDATKDVQIVGNAWSVLLNMSVDDGAGNSADFAVQRYGPDFVDNGTRPSCTSSQRGVVWKEDSAAATEDTFETCMKMDDDNYAWIEATNDFAQSGTSTLTDADDGTNEVMLRMEHDFVCSNDAGTEACGFTNDGTPDTGAEASIGTASINTHDVLAASGAADTIDIQFDTDCSLTPTTFEAAWTVEFASGYSRTATEQN
jgi:hypothetical protein